MIRDKNDKERFKGLCSEVMGSLSLYIITTYCFYCWSGQIRGRARQL